MNQANRISFLWRMFVGNFKKGEGRICHFLKSLQQV